MAVAWGLAGDGFDALQSLQVAGQARRQAFAERDYARKEAQQQQMMQGRQQAGAQLQSGDYRGAATTALQAGDFDLAKHIGDLEEGHRKQLSVQSDLLGRAAYSLRTVPLADRPAALQRLAPQLLQAGMTPEELQHADLSDEGINGYVALAQDIKTQLANQLTQARVADIGVDNQRADRVADTNIGATQQRLVFAAHADARGAAANARAAQARAEGRVRFSERGLDRAAVAAGGRGMNTSTDDLNY